MTTTSLPTPEPTPTTPVLAAETAAPEKELDPRAVHKRASKVAKELKKFIKKNPTVVYEYERSIHPAIEAWQFVAACYGHTPMVSATQEVQTEKGENVGFKSIAHLANQQGRIVSAGEGLCMKTEPDWMGKPDHMVLSMSQTRSCGKVCRNLFAFVMVLAGLSPTPAEEMPGGYQRQGAGHSPTTGKKCYECGNQVSDALFHKTRKRHGKALCVECEKKENQYAGEKTMNLVNDPKFVAESIAKVKERKAAQPIVKYLEMEPDDEPRTVNSGWRDF
jgi:hypothetical protein